MEKIRDGSEKRHFLVVAASARGARFFVKNALLQGHSITALCRAADAAAALARMEELLAGTTLTEGGLTSAGTPGKLTASNSNIFKAETFKRLLTEDPSIDALCCCRDLKLEGDVQAGEHIVHLDNLRHGGGHEAEPVGGDLLSWLLRQRGHPRPAQVRAPRQLPAQMPP